MRVARSRHTFLPAREGISRLAPSNGRRTFSRRPVYSFVGKCNAVPAVRSFVVVVVVLRPTAADRISRAPSSNTTRAVLVCKQHKEREREQDGFARPYVARIFFRKKVNKHIVIYYVYIVYGYRIEVRVESRYTYGIRSAGRVAYLHETRSPAHKPQLNSRK